MTEKELMDTLNKVIEPMSEAHQEYLKTIMDIVSNVFDAGLEVGKALQDNK